MTTVNNKQDRSGGISLPALFGEGEQSQVMAHWNQREKRLWWGTLLSGTAALYSCRTSVPLVAPAMAEDMKWSKTEIGTVLSSFFWGYSLTQIIGGYLSDKIGAERVILAAGCGWALITFWFHQISYLLVDRDRAFALIIFFRVLMGSCQGVHFPSMASITSKNLPSRERALFFSSLTGGTALGMLLTGTVGSYVNTLYGWPSVFYVIGFLAISWVAILRYLAIEAGRKKRKVVNLSSDSSDWAPLLGSASDNRDNMPWLTYLKSPALWYVTMVFRSILKSFNSAICFFSRACAICHFCQNNCFYILLSWLPTYFHDNFPGEKAWVFNVVPWLLMVPGLLVAGFVSNHLLKRGLSVASTRKIIESICMLTEAFSLIMIGKCFVVVLTFCWLDWWYMVAFAGQAKSYGLALFFSTICLFSGSFHNVGCLVNPQDLAPHHAGAVFGVMNAVGSIPGTKFSFSHFKVQLKVIGSPYSWRPRRFLPNHFTTSERPQIP